MTLNYLGHNCFEIKSKDKTILSDPFLTDNPIANTSPVDLSPDCIILTHGHFDHISDVETIAKRTKCKVLASWEITEWLSKKGVENVQPLNFGGTYKLEGMSFKFVQAHHSSSLPDGSYGGNPGSFIINDGSLKVFMAGDTSLHMDMKMFGEIYRPDVAILPLGGTFTMDVEDAIIAAKYLNVKTVIGCHYDTFEMIKIDHDQAITQFSNENIELKLMKVGESVNLKSSR